MLTREMSLTFRGRRCEETKRWRMKLIHDKWLNTNKEVVYRKSVKIRKDTYTI